MNSFIIVSALGFCACSAQAVVTEYGVFASKPSEQLLWNSAVGNNFASIPFTGFPDGTFITNQYAHLGAIFVDGDDNAYVLPPPDIP